MRKLTLSKETLRVLDDDALAEVVGGGHSKPHHPKHKNRGSRGLGTKSRGGPPGCQSKSRRRVISSD
ncbi:MAG: class I lanthipeptide [Actinomycetota bacterium]|nr:class I lanthipeptide [Actinomycetota bacterium]